jgi:hypothetical protein
LLFLQLKLIRKPLKVKNAIYTPRPTTKKDRQMTKIYSYVLRVDRGAAPNPFWGTCTLTICKPTIRRNAQIGDWVIGTGSKNVKCNDYNVHDLSDRVVYAMKISDIKTLQDYDTFCKSSLPNKIPNWQATDWRLHMGDCIYDYSKGLNPSIRKSVHDERNRKKGIAPIYVKYTLSY